MWPSPRPFTHTHTHTRHSGNCSEKLRQSSSIYGGGRHKFLEDDRTQLSPSQRSRSTFGGLQKWRIHPDRWGPQLVHGVFRLGIFRGGFVLWLIAGFGDSVIVFASWCRFVSSRKTDRRIWNGVEWVVEMMACLIVVWFGIW